MSFKGKKNVYICPAYGHGFVSLDVDDGVTPFLTPCINPLCSGSMARSFMYNVPQEVLADVTPAVEWFQPDKRAIRSLSPGARAHVEKGGLIRRQVNP